MRVGKSGWGLFCAGKSAVYWFFPPPPSQITILSYFSSSQNDRPHFSQGRSVVLFSLHSLVNVMGSPAHVFHHSELHPVWQQAQRGATWGRHVVGGRGEAFLTMYSPFYVLCGFVCVCVSVISSYSNVVLCVCVFKRKRAWFGPVSVGE